MLLSCARRYKRELEIESGLTDAEGGEKRQEAADDDDPFEVLGRFASCHEERATRVREGFRSAHRDG